MAGLAGLVAARTSPSLAVIVTPVLLGSVKVAHIAVPKAHGEVATMGGMYLRRRLKSNGDPECVPMLPHQRASRATTFGLVDASAQAVSGALLSDLDPLERERMRQSVQQYGGDRVLLELDDEALDGALGLTVRQGDGSRVPTLTGLLLLGKELALRELVGTHEFAFQVLKRTLEALVEAGLAQAHGATRGRTYTLAAGVHEADGDKAAYIRQVGFSSLQHEQMVLNYVRKHGAIRRAEVIELCRLSEGQAKDLLKRMKATELLLLEGAGRTAAYRLGAKG